MTLQITSYGNGALLTKVIMGVSYIMSNPNYLLLIQLVVILAGVVGLMVAHKENIAGGSVGLKLIGTLAVAGIVWTSFYLPQETVIVYDPVNNYQTSVRNVPVPLALPVYLENSIGNGLTNLYDAYMGSSGFPSSLSYNNTGFNWGPVATQQLQNVNFNNPFDQMTVNSYLTNCYFPAVLMGHANMDDLYNSNNILQTLEQGSQTSNAFLAEIFTNANPGGSYQDCNVTYNYIVGMVNTTTSTGSTAQSYTATVDGKTEASGLTLAQIQNNLGPSADFLLNTGLSSQQFIAQSALANSLSPAFQQFSAKYGVSDPNLSFGVAQTMYQQQTVWTQTAFMARMFLPILHFIMEAIIFGSFPLIFLMTLIPGFSKKAFGYVMSMLMWLTFWAPLMSILNGLSAWLISAHGFPLNVTGGNFNLNDMGFIYSNLRQWAAIIGSASMTVPMLAYGLATMSNFVGMEVVAGMTGAISGGINTAAQSVATEQGAQSMQGQGQQMMQNQANKAYTNPSQFDGMMQNNSEAAAAHQQALSSYIGKHGMGNTARADLAGQNYTYGQNSTMGSNAERFGELNAKQQMGSLSGLDNYAKSQGLNMEQISSINSEYGGFSTLNKARGTEAGLGGPLTSGKVNAEQQGIDSFNSAKVNDMLGLYQKERGMSPTQAASQIAYTNGIAVAVKNGKETEIFGSDGKVAMTTGQTVQNGYTENWVKDGKGNLIYSNGQNGAYTLSKNGHTNENLHNTVNNASTVNTSGRKNDLYNDQYNVGMSPGVLEGAMAYKGKGAGSFLNIGQKNMSNFILSGKAGQGYKENFTTQGIDAFAKVKDTSQINKQDIKGQLEGFAQMENKLYAGAGISFGVKAGDELVIKGGAKGSATISYGELNDMKINEFKENALNSPTVQGAKTFTQFKTALNQSFNNTTPVENQLLKAVDTKIKAMGINPIATVNSGALPSEFQEVKGKGQMG
ncbi:MAG: conjugal transfer protein TraG N-terminal domain-containing protein [bacterium]